MLQTEWDILQDYENKPRALTREFVQSLAWREVSRLPLKAELVPVLLYMRDIEAFTELYFEELALTPTGRNPAIRRFMERWRSEEAQHGELLHRFLGEAGATAESDWFEAAKARVPRRYRLESRINAWITRLFGRNFSATHMVWGAINELLTLQGYRRLAAISGHPVLETLLRGIMQEEAIHISFYYNVAELELKRSRLGRGLARFLIRHFWAPVGAGLKPKFETDRVAAALFGDAEGRQALERQVNPRVEKLPGFQGVKTILERIDLACRLSANPA